MAVSGVSTVPCMDIALASCLRLPEPDLDEELLLGSLRQAGLSAKTLGWDDPQANFKDAKLTLLRATWNYPEHPEAFRRWIDATSLVSSMQNPAEVVRWNLHKGYLLELERGGVPIVPTVLVRKGMDTSLHEICGRRGFDVVVVKPAVSAGSRKTIRVGVKDRERGEAHLRDLLLSEDALVQPYLASVEGYGEHSLIWIDGELTHAIRKSPRFDGQDESITGPLKILPKERDLAARVLAQVPGPILYARIDLAPDDHGNPVLMELELIEPSLFFSTSPAALARMTAACKRVIGALARS